MGWCVLILHVIETHLEITEFSNMQVTGKSSMWLTDSKFKTIIFKNCVFLKKFFLTSNKQILLQNPFSLPSKKKHYFTFCQRKMINILNGFGKKGQNISQTHLQSFQRTHTSFFFPFIFISWRLITMLSWVLSYIDMN